MRLDRVFVFRDQLSFLIPHEWVESEESPDYHLYHAPNADSGWLRASLISIDGPGDRSSAELRTLLEERAAKENGNLFQANDNIVAEWTQDSAEEGDPITNFWWAVGHYHGPRLSHEALFSYTVLTSRKSDSATLQMVKLVGQLVSQATFAPAKIA